ncbi:hypothetical protein [Kutzneria chonburiensis]|uniref:hypothetical protein n=1 Tax=Kutzneria chonburiensis TaxID=1483604 RepID=UPI00235FC5A8|nr:hypothetical protein [Kutzneria chonburiensis]
MPESVTTETSGGAAHQPRRRHAAVLMVAAAVASLAACTTSPATDTGHGASDMADMPGMTGMPSAPTAPAIADAAPSDTGLSASQGGYSFVPTDLSADTFTFHINGSDGRAVTRYQPYESRLVVGYLVRSDLSSYHLLDPAMQQDGTWRGRLPALHPGSYRAFVTFAAPDSAHGTPLHYTLSQRLTIPGSEPDVPLPPAENSTTVDGFTVSLAGKPTAGVASPCASASPAAARQSSTSTVSSTATRI